MLTCQSTLNYRNSAKKSSFGLLPGSRVGQRVASLEPSGYRDSIKAEPGKQRALSALIAHLARFPGFFYLKAALENLKRETGGEANFCSEVKLAGRVGARFS